MKPQPENNILDDDPPRRAKPDSTVWGVLAAATLGLEFSWILVYSQVPSIGFFILGQPLPPKMACMVSLPLPAFTLGVAGVAKNARRRLREGSPPIAQF